METPPSETKTGIYNIAVAATPTTYTITADLSQDSRCTQLRLKNIGEQEATGAGEVLMNAGEDKV